MVNQRQIEYFLKICELGNISKASRALFVSQPFLSKMLSDMEEEIGSPLFVRSRDGVVPTRAGELYRDACQRMQESYRALYREIHDLQSPQKGRIALGMSSSTGEAIVPILLEEFRKSFPDVEIALVEQPVSELNALVEKGVIDLALTYKKQADKLEYRLLRRDQIYLLLPRFFCETHPEYKPGFDNPPVSVYKLQEMPFILLKEGRGLRTIADGLFQKYEIFPKLLLETNNGSLSWNMTLRGHGFSFIPGIIAQPFGMTHEGAVFCKLKEESLERSLYLCRRKDAYLTLAMEELISIMVKLLS